MNLDGWLPTTITVATKSGVSNDGDPTFGSQSTLKARVEADRKLVRKPNGTEVESSHLVFTETLIEPDARIWLPGDSTGDNNEARRVISTKSATNKAATQTLYETRL